MFFYALISAGPRGSDINGSALLSVTVHNQSFLNPYFSAKYGLILLKSFILK